MSGSTGAAEGYVHAVLAAYQRSPGVVGRVRPADRRLAKALLDKGVALRIVQEALALAVARRQAGSQRHEPIRSLHYFQPVIEELLHQPLPTGYADYLRQRLLSDIDGPEGRPDAGPEIYGS